MTQVATRRRRKPSMGQRILGGFGEIFITLGIVLLLFVAWELWWTNIDANKAQQEVTTEFAQGLKVGTPSVDENKDFGPAPIAKIPNNETFGIFYIPRFGKDFAHPVTNGVGMDVLNTVGIGHYPDTQAPGELGNFAVAAHRQTHGQVFWDIDKFQPGDKIYLQTKEGFFTYEWRSTEIVEPSQGEVLYPVPHKLGAEPTTSILTMTSCHPPFTTRLRIIAYSELTDWRPADAGPPAAIAELVAKTMKK